MSQYRKSAHEQAVELANQALQAEARGDDTRALELHRAALALAPQRVDILFNLANALRASGGALELLEAQQRYLEVLQQDPMHLGAWNNLGTLLFETGHLSAAQTAFTAATTYHPAHIGAHVNLAQVLLHKNEISLAREQFQLLLQREPHLPEAHQGLAACAARLGDEALAAYHRDRGFGPAPVQLWRGQGPGPRAQLLILGSAQEGNIPWRFLIDHRRFDCTSIALEYWAEDQPLPAHDLCFNAIGDADRCRRVLEKAGRLPRTSPWINWPEQVLRTGRFALGQQLAPMAGLRVPRMVWLEAQADDVQALVPLLQQQGFTFPLLVRAMGYHGGQFFEQVAQAHQLANTLTQLPGSRWLALEYLETRDQAGRFRKFRMMCIDGVLYPIHLALASHWKVHYFSADLQQDVAARAEESHFLQNPRESLGSKVMQTLQALAQQIGLDYFGIDFGVNAQEEVLLFEANATMVLHPPTEDPLWDYRRPAIRQAIDATRAMFLRRIQRP